MEFRDEFGNIYEVPERSVVTIGRDPARCDIVIPPQDSLVNHYHDLPFGSIMPRHAVFWPERHDFMNEERKGVVTLTSGDVVTLGKVNLTFIGDK